ncbi:MAG: MBL fold metallo-hydrolase, partial [Chloroflexi bacterium]|nr:MBL fold metallo-hydrolase [Chloroflexota bacterium]
MADNRITVGNVEITSLSDGYIEFTPENFFPSIPAESWEPYRDELNAEGRLLLNVGSFLLRTGGKTVLVDTGLGAGPTSFQDAVSGQLLKDMDAKGVSLDEIDIVAITHLHVDHVGWNLDASGGAPRPTFPNARYWIPKTDWDIFTRRTTNALAYIQEQVAPLESLGILELIEGEQAITPELTALPTPGHTAGHTSFVITSQG